MNWVLGGIGYCVVVGFALRFFRFISRSDHPIIRGKNDQAIRLKRSRIRKKKVIPAGFAQFDGHSKFLTPRVL